MTEKIIKVVGEGEAIVTPDITRLGIRITKVFENTDEAYDENDKNYENMLSVVEKLGLPRENLRPTLFRVKEHLTDYYDDDDEVIGQVQEGFEVIQGFEIILGTDNEQVSQMVQAIGRDVDGVEISISHDTTHIKPFVKLMLEDAMNDAREKAYMLAETMGCEVKETKEIKYACHDFYVKTAPFMINSNEEALHCDEAILNIMINQISIKDHVIVSWLFG